jgi:hypothetical protein
MCRSLNPTQQQYGCLDRCWGDQNYKLGLLHEATPETRQQLIGCFLGVWLVFFVNHIEIEKIKFLHHSGTDHCNSNTCRVLDGGSLKRRSG